MTDHDVGSDHQRRAGQGTPSGRNTPSLRSKSKVGGIAIVLLLGLYSLVAPQLNAKFGWNLPQIRTDASGNVSLADSGPENASDPVSGVATVADENVETATAGETERIAGDRDGNGAERNQNGTAQQATSSGPLASRIPAGGGSPRAPPAGRDSSDESATDADADLLYGILREVSHDRFMSPQGLMYLPGSAEGHRLEHLRRHIKDNPSRPGSHGVFDGKMEGALKTIERAYERAKKGQRTTKKIDGKRTIYTVDMGSRVGYVGGREGNRKRNPMARRVRIVLEGNAVITAYPL